MNTGGPAFPQHGWSKDPEVLRRMKDQGGMTLLDWMAGQETIGDEELSTGICEHFAGPKPSGNWSTNPADWYAWEARWRAGVKYMRASAMLAEKARREADHSQESYKEVKDRAERLGLQAYYPILFKAENHSGDANKMALDCGNIQFIPNATKQPDACALLRKFIDAVPEGCETSLLWDLRKEAIHLLDAVPDYSPDAGKVVRPATELGCVANERDQALDRVIALEAANRELVEALDLVERAFGSIQYDRVTIRKQVRAILAKHKATK